MKINFLLILTITLLNANMDVLVSKKSSINNLTKNELSNIYLKKTDEVKGKKVIVINNKDDYNEFNKKVLNKNSSQIHAYWMKQIFLGRKVPPKSIDKSEVDSVIKKDPNSVTYTSDKLNEKVIYEVK